MSRIARILGILVILILVGTAGFQLIEGWSVIDSLYMSVITLTTVGFREVHDLSKPGQIFVICYIGVGIGVFLFGAAQLGELVVRAELRDWLGKRKMDSALKSLKNHYVVCGFGRMGESVCRQLAERGLSFAVIDRDEEKLLACQKEGWHWLAGDATDDSVLLAAGIERAQGLATVLGSGADNLYVVMSARLVSNQLKILARSASPKDASKMLRAGANQVVSPYQAGALKMVKLLACPQVENFIEVITTAGTEIDLAELTVQVGSPYAAKLLSETDFRKRGIIVVGIQRPEGELLLPPPSSARIEVGDILIVLGKTQATRALLEP